MLTNNKKAQGNLKKPLTLNIETVKDLSEGARKEAVNGHDNRQNPCSRTTGPLINQNQCSRTTGN